jgi:hypothetical protein
MNTSESLPRAANPGKIRVGDIELDVCIIADGTRVERLITQRAALAQLMPGTKPREKPADGMSDFLVDYVARISGAVLIHGGSSMPHFSPVRFVHPSNGKPAIGYRGEDFIAVCKFMLRARRLDALTLPQLRVAERAEVIVESFAELGVVALIDEATGYQRERGSDALQRILDRLIASKAQPYEVRFKKEFYEEICRLRGWEFDPSNPAGGFAHLTNNIVYSRLAPGVLDALREADPLVAPGVRERKLHQHLSADEGVRLLDAHINSAIELAKGAGSWPAFMRSIDRRFPKYGTQGCLPVMAEDIGDAAE